MDKKTIKPKIDLTEKLKRLDKSLLPSSIKKGVREINDAGYASSTLSKEVENDNLAEIDPNDQWFKKLRDDLYRFIYFKLGENEFEAQMMTDEVIKQFLDSSNKNIKNYRALLFRIARNRTIDWYRQKKNKTKNIDNVSEDIRDNKYLNQLNAATQLSITIKNIDKLKPEYKEIIILREIEGFEYPEIALITGKRETNLRKLLERAKIALSKLSQN